jgi:Tol biopolymer transport system component
LTPDGAAVVYDSALGDDIDLVALDLASGAQRRLTHEPGWSFSPAVSPDGKSVAFLRQKGDEAGTWVMPFDGSAPARKLVAGRVRPTWSADGRSLWAGPADGPQRIDVASGAVSRTLVPPDGYFVVRARELADSRVVGRLLDRETKRGRGLVLYGASAASGPPETLFAETTEDAMGLSPDGARLFVPKLLLPTDRVELWQVPLDGAPPSVVPTNVVLPTKGLDFARDGSRVVWSTCSTEQDIAVIAPQPSVAGSADAALEASALFPKSEWTDEDPAGVPGAPRTLVVVSDRDAHRRLWVLGAVGHATPRPLPIGEVEAAAPAVSPDGRWVAFTAIGKGLRLVPLEGAAEGARVLTTGASDTKATFAQAGAAIFFETASARGRAIARVSIEGGEAQVVLEGAERPAASPTEGTLAYVAMDGEEGTPMLFDVSARRSRRLSPALGKGTYGALRFSPDGRRVLVAVGLTSLAEVDARTGSIVRRFTSGDQITGITYAGGDIVAARQGWRGDVWLAQEPWGAR